LEALCYWQIFLLEDLVFLAEMRCDAIDYTQTQTFLFPET